MTTLGRYWVYTIAALMSLLAIIALSLNAYGIYICYIKNDPPGAFGYFTAALLISFGAFAVVTAALLVTNTRRPRGIDPDAPLGPVLGFDKETLDAFSITTDEVLKHEKRRVRPEDVPLDDATTSRLKRRATDQDDTAVENRRKREPHVVIDERGEPYGRRATDIPISDIKRTIDAVRQIRTAGGDPSEVIKVPDWVEAVDKTHRALHPEAEIAMRDLDLAPPNGVDMAPIESLDVAEVGGDKPTDDGEQTAREGS